MLGVEVAVLAGDALIDRVGDHVGDAPPVLRASSYRRSPSICASASTSHRRNSTLSRPSALRSRHCRDQRLRVDRAPVGEARRPRMRRRRPAMKAVRIDAAGTGRSVRGRPTPRRRSRRPSRCWRRRRRRREIAIGIGFDMAVGDVDAQLGHGAAGDQGEKPAEREQRAYAVAPTRIASRRVILVRDILRV